MAILFLKCGAVVRFDDEWMPIFSKMKWYLVDSRGSRYARTFVKDESGKKTPKMMHHFVIDRVAGKVVDHRDGNGLNNRKANLRIATYSQNMCNSAKRRPRRCKYKGVVRVRRKTVGFSASIRFEHKYKYLGTFATEEDAAVAYDLAAIKIHGEFAYTNFPRSNYDVQESRPAGAEPE